MPWFRKRPNALERVLAEHERAEAVIRGEYGGCNPVRTPQGRTVHLEHPEHGVLCRWPSSSGWVPAVDPMPVCVMCKDELRKLRGEAAAS